LATAIRMPKLGMSMREGRVVSWAVPLGGAVARGRTVLVIESEKAEVEIEATASGVLRHVYVPAGETVPCGALLGAIAEGGDAPFDAEAFRREHDRPEAGVASAAAASPPRSAATRAGPAGPAPARVPVAPAARARARELGIDPERIPGTGPGSRVTREDVEAFAVRLRDRCQVAPGVALEVPATGEGEPVLLLPGFGSDVAVFARQVPVLAAGYRVLGVNPRGVSGSDAPAQERYDVAEAAADAAAVTGGPLHLVGASLGAAVALELALAQPERVRSLVLVTPFLVATPRLLAVLDAWCRLAGEASPTVLAGALAPWLLGSATLADAAVRGRIERGLAEIARRVPAETLVRQAAGLRAWSGSRRSDLARVSAPTLVVAGGEDLLTAEGGAIADAIPGASCCRVPGAGHAVAIEAADAVNEAIVAHLAAVAR